MSAVPSSVPGPDASPDDDVVVFVGGCDRSGTTLAARLIAEQLSLVSLPEAYFHAVAFRRFGPKVAAATALRHWRRRSWGIGPEITTREPLSSHLRTAMVELHDERRGPGKALRVVESTPENIEIGSILLEEFPTAQLVHFVRDPRGVAASLRRMDFGPRTVQECARLWKQRVASGLALELQYPDRVHRLRYEDLVVAPADLRSLRDAVPETDEEFVRERDLMVEFSSETVQTRSAGSVDVAQIWAWREALTPRQVGQIEFECRELMNLFGYLPVGVPDARGGTRRRLDSLRSTLDELTLTTARRAVRVGRAFLRR